MSDKQEDALRTIVRTADWRDIPREVLQQSGMTDEEAAAYRSGYSVGHAEGWTEGYRAGQTER